MALKVRAPDRYDSVALMDMAAAMHAESPRYKNKNFSETKALGIINYFIDSSEGGAFVLEENGTVIGMIAGIICEHFFGLDKYVSDLVVYITPEKRGGSSVIRLVRAFEEWAFSKGACEVLLGVSTGIEMDRTVALYQRLGYTLTACALIKEKPHV